MAALTPAPGDRIGRYDLLAHIATGGMGEVFRARDIHLGRIVALKILPNHLAANPAIVERFRREARAAALLTHKNIVTLYDFGQEEGVYYLAMEFVDGVDLYAHIEEKGKLEPAEATHILVQAVKALDHAFHQGITHRDIKPSNFLLAARSEGRFRVKLTDLGLARTVGDEDFRVTRDGSTVGTIDYMSPEQARDSSLADIRSDIYSLGCTFYHMLAGRPPFPEGGLGERVYRHQQLPPPDVRQHNPQVPGSLWAVLEKMLQKDPVDRYQTPAELLAALLMLGEKASSSRSGRRRDPSPSPPSGVKLPPPPPIPHAPSKIEEDRRPHIPTRRTSQVRRVPEPPSSATSSLEIRAEQRAASAGQFERAREVMASDNRDLAYAQQLLLSCCQLDPANLTYRKTLRQVGLALRHQQQGVGRWLAPLAAWSARGKFRSARHAGDHRGVLSAGEEVLARSPEDLPVQREMAEAADALGLPELAVWLLEQACRQSPSNTDGLRLLAAAYEKGQDLDKAIAVWEAVRKLDPQDYEVDRKLKSLTVRDTLSRGHYDV